MFDNNFFQFFQATPLQDFLRQMLRIRERLQPQQQIMPPKPSQSIVKKSCTKVQDWIGLLKHNNSNLLKKHIHKFFLIQGHLDIANQFIQQANLSQNQYVKKIDQQKINKRSEIVKLVRTGKVEQALKIIEKLDIFMEIQTKNYQVQNQREEEEMQILFCLKSQKILNLIKQKQYKKAIQGCRIELLPLAVQNIHFMPQIQSLLSLLILPPQPSHNPCTQLSSTSRRLNKLLLNKQLNPNPNDKCQSYDSLLELVRLIRKMEERLELFGMGVRINLVKDEIFRQI